ncbi:MAG: DNA polymerase III subunit beta [Pseudomonadales bacterium]
MKFSIARDTFLNGLQLVAGVVERRQTLPVLSNALFVLDDSGLSITGTDLEVEVVSKIQPQSVEQTGTITIPARKLFDIVRSLSDDAQIEVSTEDDRAVIKSGRSRFTLSTLPASEFPNVEEGVQSCQFDIAQGQLKSLIDKVSFSMAQQDVRYYLNGMLFEVSPEHLRLVATDGHRLAMTTLDTTNLSPDSLQAILPRKGVLELSRMLSDGDEEVSLGLGSNHVCVTAPGYKFTSKLVDGKFPDYERVLPRNAEKIIESSREGLKQSFSRAAILSNEKYRGVRMQLEQGLIRITANNPEQEQAEEEVAVNYDGEPLEIGFNVSYMIEALATLKSDDVQISLADPNSSALMQAKGDGSTLYVIMPMRL